MLDCRISYYFTANTQILWPGREVRAHSLDTWFTCTIKHTAGKYTATAFLVQGHEDREHQTPGQLHQGIAEQTHVSGNAPLGNFVHTYIPNEARGRGRERGGEGGVGAQLSGLQAVRVISKQLPLSSFSCVPNCTPSFKLESFSQGLCRGKPPVPLQLRWGAMNSQPGFLYPTSCCLMSPPRHFSSGLTDLRLFLPAP